MNTPESVMKRLEEIKKIKETMDAKEWCFSEEYEFLESLEFAMMCPDCEIECDVREHTKLNDEPGTEHWVMDCPECGTSFVIEFKDGELN